MRQAKKVESLDDAENRVLETKLDEAERVIVQRVFSYWRDGRLPTPTARVSKKSVFEAWEAWREGEKERKKRLVVESKPANHFVVTDIAEWNRIVELLRHEEYVAWDSETTGLDLYNDRIIAVNAYLPSADIAFYASYGHIDPSDKEAFVKFGVKHGFDAAIEKYRLTSQLTKTQVLDPLREIFADPRHKTIWANFKYDGHMLANEGIDVANVWWDVQPAMRILNDNEPSYKLKLLYEKYVDKSGDPVTFEDLFDDFTIFDKPLDLAGAYGCLDGVKTWGLYEFQKPWIDKRDRLRIVWYEIEQPLLKIDLETEREGFRLDLDWLKRLEVEYQPKLDEAERSLRQAFNLDAPDFLTKMSERLGKTVDAFNVQSNDHLAYLIYDVGGADPAIGLRFKKGLRTTDKDVVDVICEDTPELAPLLEYRTMAKLLGTYVKTIPASIEPATGRFHVSFNNGSSESGGRSGTSTGRYSSSEYCSAKNSRTGDVKKGGNLQNLPSRNELGKKVRMAFVPEPGNVFLHSDLSQIEPRWIAHLLYTKMNDDSMKRIYDAGVDLYTTMAMNTFNLDRAYCMDKVYDPTHSYQPRSLMKTGVLAYLYGQSAKSFAKKMNVSDAIATQFFEGMAKSFPGLAPLRDSIINDLRTKGNAAYSETESGRKRRYPNHREWYAELKRLDKDGWKRYTRAKSLRAKKGAESTTDDEQTELDELERIEARRRELWGKCSAIERAAINHATGQGNGADTIKRIIIRLKDECRKRGWRYKGSIHDEVWIEVPKADVTPDNIALLDDVMTNTVKLAVPLKCDTVVADRWMNEFSPDDWFAKAKEEHA